jgi:hypothetical protein
MYMGLGWTPHHHHHGGGHGGGWGGGFWDGGEYPVAVEPDVVAVTTPTAASGVTVPTWALWAGGIVGLILLLKGGH